MKKILFLIVALVLLVGCDEASVPTTETGVKKASVKVTTDAEGLTIEQKNIRGRLLEDNKPGSIKHLYVLSAYSGQVLIYSTVRGKVTSGGKRLTPTSVAAIDGQYVDSDLRGMSIAIGNKWHRTSEVLQDDGTYGSSSPYLYWWDTKGVYHQHYVSGGQIVHVSNQPVAVKSVLINMTLEPAQ